MTTSNTLETMGKSDQFNNSAKHKKQYFIIGGLCLLAVVVIVAVILSVLLLRKEKDNLEDIELDDIELDDILEGKLQPKRFNGTWINDKSFYYFDSNRDFVIFNAESNSREVRVSSSSAAYNSFLSSSLFEFSADEKNILLALNTTNVYRHSFFALWKVFNVESGTVSDVRISDSSKNSKMISVDPETLDGELFHRLVKFSSVNSSMIIVNYDNNMYYKSTPEADPIEVIVQQKGLKVFNGVPDWVYEEEVFSSNSATWFSKDGKKIAFIQFDDTNVPTITMPIYGLPQEYNYPKMIPVSYPKAGVENPAIKLLFVDLDNFDKANLPKIKEPDSLKDDEYLITSVGWANENVLISVWMNRIQNKGLIYKCTEPNDCVEILSLDRNDGWIEFFTAPIFNSNGTEMIFIGSTNGYRHIKALDLNTKNVANRTSGKFIVTEILKYNKVHDVIIYTANTEEDVKAQHLYAIKNENGAAPVCLTCELFKEHSYFSARVSQGGSYLIINSGGPGVPRSDLYALKVEGNNIMLSDHMEIENNDDLRNTLDKKNIPKRIYDVIKLDNENEAYVMMTLPQDLDEGKKYPMLVDVYGGPDSSSVTNRFLIDWGTYLASSLGIIYVEIDGRASGLRSDKNLYALYGKLGTVEVDDQVTTAQKLVEKYSYLDSSRVGIWGWSYGGYVSGMSLMRDNDVYKCAASVAPVTDWELYDSIYTERYMKLPKDNLQGYNISRMAYFVQNIPKYNKQYMLVHGSADDNVHFQQSMVLARVLERADIQFKEISYPDEDHSLADVRPHLYHSLERFFRECFDLK